MLNFLKNSMLKPEKFADINVYIYLCENYVLILNDNYFLIS